MSEPGQLYFNGDIYTVDQSNPRPQAVAVQDGKIIAVGDAAKCKAALGKDFEAIDLRGAALLPGFIDTHLHPVPMIYFDLNLDLRGVKSMAGLQEEMRGSAKTLGPGAWMVGLQFDEQEIKEQRLPARHDLDLACPDRPALVIKHDGHMIIANTRAIAAAGVDAATKDPEGGVIDREPDGFPSGVFREAAGKILVGAMPMPEIPLMVKGAEHTFKKLAGYGITSVGAVLQTSEEGPAGAQGAFDVIAMNLFLPQVPVSLYSLIITLDPAKLEAAMNTALNQGRHRVGGVKIYADGTFGSCTAYMRAPFTDQPDKSGFMVHQPEEIYGLMVEAHKRKIQVAVHAIGDRANLVCIDLFERLLKEHPRPDHRHRIEHASILDAQMIKDLRRLGLVVSTQPLFIHSEKSWLHKRLGPERAKWTYPLRSLADAGVKVAGASDAPVESIDVLHAVQCCVTREGFETHQCLSAEQAVRMFTIDAAFAQHEDSIKGSISEGKRADLVALSKNPVAVAPEKIRELRVLRTIVAGKVVCENG